MAISPRKMSPHDIAMITCRSWMEAVAGEQMSRQNSIGWSVY